MEAWYGLFEEMEIIVPPDVHPQLFIDSDNAMGSSRGDVDDGFALASLLGIWPGVCGLGAVGGNTSAQEAYQNNLALAEKCGWDGPVLQSHEVPDFLGTISSDIKILALGPLSNIAKSLDLHPALQTRVREIIVVGSHSTSIGRWPPFFPFEYNLTKDRKAAQKVFSAGIPITIMPLNVARELRMSMAGIDSLPGVLGAYLTESSRRWIWRSRLLWWQSTVAVWDLAAAMYVRCPELFKTRQTRVVCHSNARVEFDAGTCEVTLIEEMDEGEIWLRFKELLKERVEQEAPL